MSKTIENTICFVKKTLNNVESGHDWWHIFRVWNTAKLIAEKEKCNMFIVEMAALLHDIADSKFYNGDEEIGPKMASNFLKSQKVKASDINNILEIIRNVSFKGGNFQSKSNSIELRIVQDADRLDAIGAIGIARTFNYGGFKNRLIYDPEIKPNMRMTKEEYKNSTTPTINHFYEKLLLLKERMNTKTGRRLAEERHAFLEMYLTQFFKEWNAEF